jgi:cytochrome d ubiquinol oxidase subunit II
MIYLVLLFLFVGILFYLVFGGADFGVGVLELFSSKKNRALNKNTYYRVIGPVWEANHVWLILVLVIMWVGFPGLYTIIMVQLHIPLTLLLVGIVFRGTAFIFRHYDAKKDETQPIYDRVFEWASLFSTLLIGITAGALVSGKMIPPTELQQASFYDAYMASWIDPFSLAMGAFFSGMMAYLSATYLIGESQGKQTDYFRKKMIGANVATVLSGGLVLLFAYLDEAPFLNAILSSPAAITCITLATVLLFPIWRGISLKRKLWIRIYVTAQIFLVLLAYVVATFPHLAFTGDKGINIMETQSSESVIQNLGIMLIIGGIIILPAVFYLFKTFGMFSVTKSDEKDD